MNSKSEGRPLPAISSVHDAIQNAVIERSKADAEKKVQQKNLTVRMNPKKKELLGKICQTHGVKVSDFFRSCSDLMLQDYLGPEEYALQFPS